MHIDQYYLRMAYEVARHSGDLSTQNGAVLVPRNRNIYLVAHNDIPAGVTDTPERRERPAKYAYTEHAERAVLFLAANYGFKTYGATLYCPWYACADCARGIILSGVTRVVGHKTPLHESPRWAASIADAMTMLREAGVQCDWIEGEFGLTIRFDGKEVRV